MNARCMKSYEDTTIGKQQPDKKYHKYLMTKFIQPLQEFLLNSFLNKKQLNQQASLSQIFLAQVFHYLAKLLEEQCLRINKPANPSIITAAIKIRQHLQEAVKRYELPYHMQVFYDKMRAQPQSFQQLHWLFINCFTQNSFMIYSQQPKHWKQLARFAVYQFGKIYETGQEQMPKYNISEDLQIQELQRYCQTKLQKIQLQQVLQSQKDTQRWKQQLKQLQQFQKKIMSKSSKLSQKKSGASFIVAKFKSSLNIKTMMILETNFDIIRLVDECQTYGAPFLLFLIPFNYLLAQTLSYYEPESVQNISIYTLFQELIKKINVEKCKRDNQISESQILDHIVTFANYFKYSPQMLSSKMGQFLKKYGQKMKGFIPVFFDIFSFHAFEKYEFIQQLQNIKDVQQRRQKLLQRIERLHNDYQKYNSLGLQDKFI